MKKNFLVWGFELFVRDIISGVLLGLCGPLHVALAQTAKWQYFAEVFIGNSAKI